MRSSLITFYIDTTSNTLYTGLVKNDTLLIEIQEKLEKDLSTYTLSKIEEMFQKVNLTPKDIDKIIVVNGPGSFTGIRIGITIAKTFAWSLKKDITTITSLEAMAVSTEIQKFKVPIIDARRGYVFAGIYNEENEPILKNQYIKLDTLIVAAESLNVPYQLISNDASIENIISYKPNILKIVSMYKNKPNINPHSVNPEYLKKTEAEENKGIVVE